MQMHTQMAVKVLHRKALYDNARDCVQEVQCHSYKHNSKRNHSNTQAEKRSHINSCTKTRMHIQSNNASSSHTSPN